MMAPALGLAVMLALAALFNMVLAKERRGQPC
jgi:hypothetical protein